VIVRPSWLTDDPGGQRAIRFEQGDTGEGEISRGDVATVVVAALGSARARGKTFEIYNQPGAPPEDWDAAFAGLTRD
jgi:NAD(P)H-binding